MFQFIVGSVLGIFINRFVNQEKTNSVDELRDKAEFQISKKNSSDWINVFKTSI